METMQSIDQQSNLVQESSEVPPNQEPVTKKSRLLLAAIVAVIGLIIAFGMGYFTALKQIDQGEGNQINNPIVEQFDNDYPDIASEGPEEEWFLTKTIKDYDYVLKPSPDRKNRYVVINFDKQSQVLLPELVLSSEQKIVDYWVNDQLSSIFLLITTYDESVHDSNFEVQQYNLGEYRMNDAVWSYKNKIIGFNPMQAVNLAYVNTSDQQIVVEVAFGDACGGSGTLYRIGFNQSVEEILQYMLGCTGSQDSFRYGGIIDDNLYYATIKEQGMNEIWQAPNHVVTKLYRKNINTELVEELEITQQDIFQYDLLSKDWNQSDRGSELVFVDEQNNSDLIHYGFDVFTQELRLLND